MANTRKTRYVSLSGGTNITAPVYEIPEGDFIYTFNVEPNETNGLNSSSGYERIDGNNTNPSNAILSIYEYSGLTGTVPVQGDNITVGADNFTVCGVTEDTATSGIIYVLALDNVAPAVSVWVTGSGGFATTSYRFIQRLIGSKFPPKLLSETERDFYDYCLERQRDRIDEVPGEGPVVGVVQDPNDGRLLAIRKDTVSGNDLLYEAIPGTGWTQIAGTAFTNSSRYYFVSIQLENTSNSKLYIANGVDLIHSYDSTGPTVATVASYVGGNFVPKYLEEHQNSIVYANGNEVAISDVLGDFTSVNANILYTKDSITGLSRLVDEGLLVGTESAIYIQQGSLDPSAPDYGAFKEHSSHTGINENTLDSSDYPYFINRYGINNLVDTYKSGDFVLSILSDKVSPIVNNNYDKDGVARTTVGAFIDRDKELYRVYRSDGTCINTLITEERGFPITFNDYQVGLQCIEEFQTVDEEYVIAGSGFDSNFVGDYSGFVYKMESGFSLDGDFITHSLKTPYLHMNSPAVRKRFFKYTMNVFAPEEITVTYKADFNIGDSRYSEQLDLDSISGTSRFNIASFNASTFSGNFIDEVGGYINGSGINISLNINVKEKNREPFTLQGIIYHYKQRGLKR